MATDLDAESLIELTWETREKVVPGPTGMSTAGNHR